MAMEPNIFEQAFAGFIDRREYAFFISSDA